MTAAPYNFSTTATGLMFLSALIGSVFGYLTGVFADTVVVFLARRNGGVKEPEMRLWTLCISFVYAGAGYLLYGWGAEEGLHWVAVAFGLGCMIAHQVSACSIATAYAMDSFPGVSPSLRILLWRFRADSVRRFPAKSSSFLPSARPASTSPSTSHCSTSSTRPASGPCSLSTASWCC